MMPLPIIGGGVPFRGVLDGLSSAPVAAYSAMRRLSGAYTGPLLRARRADNTLQDIGFVRVGNDMVRDSADMLNFVSATASVAAGGFLQLTNSTVSGTTLSSFTGSMGGASIGAPLPITASSAVFPITASGSFWVACLDGGFTKAVQIGVTVGAGTVGLRVLAARFITGDRRSDIAQAGTWSTTNVATSASAGGYGVTGVTVGTPGSAWADTLYDQSGNLRHATQTTPGAQPGAVEFGIVEPFGLRGGGFGTRLNMPNFAAQHIIAVVRPSTAGGGTPFRGITSSNNTLLLSSVTGGNWGTWASGATNASTVALSAATPYVLTMSGGSFFTNGVASGTYSSTSGQTMHIFGQTDGQSFTGSIAEVYFFTSLTAADRQTIERSAGVLLGFAVA